MELLRRCEHCEAVLRVRSEAAGRRARCPACGHVFVIPSPRELLEELAASWGQDQLDEALGQWRPIGEPTGSSTSGVQAVDEGGAPFSAPATQTPEVVSTESDSKQSSSGGDAGETIVAASAGAHPAAQSTREEHLEQAPPDQREPAAGPNGEPIALSDRPLVIGRGSDCDIRYRSRTLSRRHARIYPEQGAYVIEDLGSTNGVEVDAQVIQAPYELRSGQIITLGLYEFEFDGKHLISLRDELSEDELRREGRQ